MSDDHDAPLLAAIDSLQSAEGMLAEVTKLRKLILDLMEELELAVASLPQTQLNLRMARLRLTAMLRSDPDKTPIENKGISQLLKAVDPSKPTK